MSPKKSDRKLLWLQGRKRPIPVMAALRAALGKSQPEFAELLGTSQSSVSDWERGQYIPARRAVQIVKMLKALGEDRAGLTPTEAHLLDRLTVDILQEPAENYLPLNNGDSTPYGNHVHG